MRHLIRALALAMVITGCGGGGGGGGITPPPPPPDPAPVPNSASNAVRLLEWSMENKDTLKFREVLAGQYLFKFQPADTTGTSFGGQLTRDQEITIFRHMLYGGAAEPVVTSIDIAMDPTFSVQDDSRPGKNPTWHKEIRTSVAVTVTNPSNSYSASGFARFYLVRGDSAVIPADLVARGITADPGRWFIEQWSDETILTAPQTGANRPGVRPSSPSEAHEFTWGRIKGVYR